MTMGNALDVTMKAWWQGQDPADALSLGIDRLSQEYQEQEKWPLGSLIKLLEKGYKVARQGHPHMPGWEVWKEGEKLVKASGTGHGPNVDGALIINGRYAGTPDLITQTEGSDKLIITDLKVAMRLLAEWVPKRLAEYDTALQAWQYSWAVWQVYGKEVEEFRFQQISLDPVRNHVATVNITRERLLLWLESMKRVWREMEVNEVYQNLTNCMGKYGRCEYLLACHECHLENDQMAKFYDKIMEPEPEKAS